MPIQKSILIDVDFDILMQRLTGRLTCEDCGEVFNIFTNPPSLEEECDKCGGKLHHRSDDNEETIGKRLRVYETQTKPVADYYRDQGKLSVIEGKGEIRDIFNAMQNVLKTARPDSSISKPAATPAVTPPPAASPAASPTASQVAKPAPLAPTPAPAQQPVTPAPVARPAVASKAPAPVVAPAAQASKPASKPAVTAKKPAVSAPAAMTETKTIIKKAVAKKKPAAKKVSGKKMPAKKSPAKKPAGKKTLAKKSTGSANTPQALNNQLKQLQTELKKVKAELTLTEKRCKELIKLDAAKDKARQQLSAQRKKDLQMSLKKMK